MRLPLITVIIPYYRRGDIFERCLDSVLNQEYPRREIIVIDDHSDDGLEERIAARHAEIKLITNPANLGACVARNRGIRTANGEILVFIDDDMSFASPSALAAIVDTFDAHREIAILALQV